MDLAWTLSRAIAPADCGEGRVNHRLDVAREPGAVLGDTHGINEVHSRSQGPAESLLGHGAPGCPADSLGRAVSPPVLSMMEPALVSGLRCEETRVRCQVYFVFQRPKTSFIFLSMFLQACDVFFKDIM